MSLSFDLIENRRRAVERARRCERAQAALLWLAGAAALAAICAGFAWTLFGFIFL